MTIPVKTTPPFDIDDFREQVGLFCRAELPGLTREKRRMSSPLDKADVLAWERKLVEQGWYTAHWPRQYGGQDWSRLQRFIFIETLEREGAPWLTPFGIDFAGPSVYTFGTAAQKAAWLPPIRQCTTFWCQGFSEPGAGSDLAALRTRARRDGDHYLVSGHKIWTTMAHWADMILLLARTNETERPQEGISLLLVDMKSPGISVRPIITLDLCHSVNEVFFDNVRVPLDNLLGTEGQAWHYARFILARERPLALELGKAGWLLDQMHTLAGKLSEDGNPLVQEPAFRRRLAELEIERQTLQALAHQVLVLPEDDGDLARAAMLKLRGSELQQKITGACVELLGRFGLLTMTSDGAAENVAAHPCQGLPSTGLWREHLHARATTIYGGSSEIQRNILAKALFAG